MSARLSSPESVHTDGGASLVPSLGRAWASREDLGLALLLFGVCPLVGYLLFEGESYRKKNALMRQKAPAKISKE